MPEPRLCEFHGLIPRPQRPRGDFQLHVELPELEIGLGHSAHDLEDNRSAVLFPGEQVPECGLIGAADPSPDIEFPGEIALNIVVERVGEPGERPHSSCCRSPAR